MHFRHQPGAVRCPADFTRMKQISTYNDVYFRIIIRHHASQETALKKERLNQILTVMEVKPTVAQYCVSCNRTCYLSSA